MDFNNVKAVSIGNDAVKGIRDKNGTLLWSKEVYTVKYGGDTTQQTYTGKNLFNAPSTPPTAWQCTYTKNNNNSITITTTGTPPSAYAMIEFNIEANTQYTLSFNSDPVVIRTRIEGTYNDPSISSGTYNFTTGSSGTVDILFYTVNPDTSFSVSSITINNLQLEKGSTATTYEPYVGGIPAPNPDYPQTVNTVTGLQVVTITDGGNQSQSYTVDLGSIELCKIGTYQDYIYKSGDDWYMHKETGKVVYNGSEDWGYASTYPRVSISKPSDIGSVYQDQATTTKCSHFIAGNSGDSSQDNVYNIGTTNVFFKSSSIMSSLSQWTTWLTSNPVTFYYALVTATDTQITNADLIAQLNAINNILVKYGYQSTISGNLPLVINKTSI